MTIISSNVFFEKGGETGGLIRSRDWTNFPLGAPDNWPSTLLTSLGIILNNNFPMILFWGKEHLCFYNDAYRPRLVNRGKHPNAIGRPAEKVWPEIWDIIKPRIDHILAGGNSTWNEDNLWTLLRNGEIENVYWTSSYSPVLNETGICGVLVTFSETTEKKKVENQLKEKVAELSRTFEREKAILNGIPANIAIVNRDGIITSVNSSWTNFAKENGVSDQNFLGANYIKISRESASAEGIGIAEGIEKIFDGAISEFKTEYACHSPSKLRWFVVKILPLFFDNTFTELIVMHLDITTRKLYEIDLLKSQETLEKAVKETQKILDASLDVICTTDRDGKFVQVSRACKEVWGYDQQELLGKNYIDLVTDEDKQKTIEIAAAILNGKKVKFFENNFIKKDQSVVPLIWSANWDEKEELMFSVSSDASEIKKAETKIKEYSERINNILERITDGFFAVDQNWIVTYWNSTAEKILGTKYAYILGKNLWEVYENAIPLKFYTEYHRAKDENTSVHFEEFFPPLDMWVEVSAFPSENGLSVYFKDVTESRKSSEEIRIAKERYDLLSKATKDAIWDWDVLTNKLYWGEGFTTLFGHEIERTTISFDVWTQHLSTEDKDRVIKSVIAAINNPNIFEWTEDYRYQKKDGSYAYVNDRAYIIRDESGKAIRVFGVMQDVTERNAQSRAIEKQNVTLKEITWMQSHLLRAPLTRLMGLVNLLKEDDFDEAKRKELLEYVDKSALQLDDVIRQVVRKAELIDIRSTKLLKILLVDDDNIELVIQELFLDSVADSVPRFTALNGHEALNHLNREKRENEQYLIFLDINMPVMDGWEFLSEVETRYKEDIFVVMVTSSINSEDLVRARKYKSVIHFVQKPLSNKDFNIIKSVPKLSEHFR